MKITRHDTALERYNSEEARERLQKRGFAGTIRTNKCRHIVIKLNCGPCWTEASEPLQSDTFDLHMANLLIMPSLKPDKRFTSLTCSAQQRGGIMLIRSCD